MIGLSNANTSMKGLKTKAMAMPAASGANAVAHRKRCGRPAGGGADGIVTGGTMADPRLRGGRLNGSVPRLRGRSLGRSVAEDAQRTAIVFPSVHMRERACRSTGPVSLAPSTYTNVLPGPGRTLTESASPTLMIRSVSPRPESGKRTLAASEPPTTLSPRSKPISLPVLGPAMIAKDTFVSCRGRSMSNPIDEP